MEKFKRQADETVLKKGQLVYSQGEPGVKNYFKGEFKVTQCDGILTSKRLVLCKRRRYLPWGVLIWLIIALRARRIVFAIPLEAISSIKKDKKLLVVKAADGSEYKLNSDTIFDKSQQWVQAISDAVTAACAGAKAQASEGLVEFVKA